MSPGTATALLFGILIVSLAAGVPFVFAIGGTAVISALLLWGSSSLTFAATQTMGVMLNTVLMAIPLFILMAHFLQNSGMADDLYGLMYSLFGRIAGGLAAGTVIICMLFAAMAGISGAATLTMGVIALPSMLKRNYHKNIAIGCISAGGALGILIPPSVTMVLLGIMAEVSVGRLFAGGILPGILLGALFIMYVIVRCRLDPSLGPALPREDRLPLMAILPQFRALILPILLILGVLGSIFSGIATPTEAASVGALGAIICTAISRRLSWSLVKDCCNEALKLSCMVMWIIVCAVWLTAVYQAIGGPDFVNQTIQSLGLSRWVILIGMQIVLILLGMIMETGGIIMITTPIFIPIIVALGFDRLWFCILFIMNMEMGYLTPPFGFNLFYMKAIVPEGVTMVDIYRSITPFVFLQLIGLIIVMLVPEIATIIPDLLFG